jgi:diguanylate cyclase (GGDEF)-like protein
LEPTEAYLQQTSQVETTTDTASGLIPGVRLTTRKVLGFLLWAMVGIHAVLVVVLRPQPIAASRYCTAAVAVLAALCALWRAQQVRPRERFTWHWAAAGILLWAAAHTVETILGPPLSASNLAVDPSDFIYIIAAFPLLLALSTTRETASIRSVFFFNCAQIGLAFVLTYFLLYRTSLPAATAATVMGKIYGFDCVLLAILAALRLFTWVTSEERRSIGLIFVFLCTYLPVELGMDYATARWKLQAGNLFDLLWSIPFVLAGWQALRMQIDSAELESPTRLRRGRLLVETLCPMLITMGVFALAASVTGQHAVLALLAIFLLLAIQGLQAGVLQLNYLTGRVQLLDREQELRTANATLQQLSLLDPLTGIANRRRFDAALDSAWRRAVRRKQTIALLIIDVDYFKAINDQHGHTYGDECLVRVARVLGKQTGRPDDLLARYGGDEFFLLLPDTDDRGAMVIAERIHAAIRVQAPVNYSSSPQGSLTVSIGAGVIGAQSGKDPAELVDVADRALYEAKRLGRNTTHLQTI